MKRRWLLATVAMIATAYSNAASQQSAGASISGVVVEGDARTPVPFAQVAIAPANPNTSLFSRPPGQTTVTGADGTFAFDNINPGPYLLGAFKVGYVVAYYQGTGPASNRPGPPLPIAAGERRTDLELKLVRGGAISGRVTDQYGEPAVGAEINWTLGTPPSPQTTLYFQSSYSMGHSDARGMYRLYGLAPGDYIVSAKSHGESLRLGSPDGVRVSYIPSYYPGTTDRTRAETISVAAGVEREGIDLKLSTAGLYNVEGTLVLPPDVKRDEIQLSISPLDTYVHVYPRERGAFIAEGIPPGDYQLLAYTEAYWARLPLSVRDRNVTGLSLTMQPTMTVSGTAVAAPDSPAIDLTRCNIALQPVEASSFDTVPASSDGIGGAGRFIVKRAVPGRYRFVAWLGTSKLRVVSATIDGRAIAVDGLEVRQGSHVTGVVLTIRQ